MHVCMLVKLSFSVAMPALLVTIDFAHALQVCKSSAHHTKHHGHEQEVANAESSQASTSHADTAAALAPTAGPLGW